MGVIRLTTLGRTELESADGRTILSVLSQPKRLALLIYLAVAAPGGFVRRDRLVALFWPEHDQERARANLSKGLSFLRKSLGPDVVLTRGDEEVGVDPETLSCDAVSLLEPRWAGATTWPNVSEGWFLDGFHFDGAPGEWDTWVEGIAERVERLREDAVRSAESVDPSQLAHEPAAVPGVGHDSAPKATSSVPAATASRWRTIAIAGWAVAALALAWTGWVLLGRGPGDAQTSREVLSTESAPISFEWGRLVALAPDASSRVLPDSSGPTGVRLALKTRGSLEIVPIPGTDDARDVTYSPDGQSIAYVVGTELKTRPLAGGSPVTLAADVVQAGGVALAWLDDRSILYERRAPDRYELVRISEGGEPLSVIPHEGGGAALRAHGLPGSRGALLIVCTRGHCLPGGTVGAYGTVDVWGSTLHIVDFEAEASSMVREQVVRAWYAPTGHVVYVNAEGAALAAPFDLEAMELTGPGTLLFEGVRVGAWGADMLLGDDGTMLYVEGSSVAGPSRLVWVDRSGREEPLDANMDPQRFATLALSADGRRLAVSIGEEESITLWVKDLPDGPLERLTSEQGLSSFPVWSADGTTISYAFDNGDTRQFRTVPADGGSVDDFSVLLEREEGVWESRLTPDERGLVFTDGTVYSGEADLHLLDLQTSTVDDGFLASQFTEAGTRFSPDGRWMAYASNVTGEVEIYVRPFPLVGDDAVRVSLNGGLHPLFAHNGRELFYRERETGSLIVATYTTDPTFRVESRQSLPIASPSVVQYGLGVYDVSRDDERFLVIRLGGPARDNRLILVEDFFEELERRVEN